jgi:signal transduction histidine kinase/CheY-like chemotaxis protein
MATSGVAVVLLSLAFMTYDLRRMNASRERRLTSEADIVGYNCATAILFRDADSARTTLAALKAESMVSAAAVYDGSGRLFATYLRDGVGSVPLPAAIEPHGDASVAQEPDALVLRRPAVLEGKTVGMVLIRADLAERTALLRRYALIAFAVGAAVFAIAVLLSLRLQGMIVKPILALADTAGAVSASKDYSVRASDPRVEELAPLVRTFNEMLENVQRREAELQESSRELKRIVEERTTLYRQAAEANRLKDDFLATLSHELRTPLNAIVGWTATLQIGGLDAETTRKALDAISRNAKAQTTLIEDILDVSRIVSGKFRLSVREVDLASVIRAAVEAVQHAADARQIRIQLVLDDQGGQIFGDADRLQQAFWNILSNAIRFTPAGGRVYVKLWRPNSHAEVVVSDSGVGIGPEFLPHVFERFRQADASSTRAHGGLGLGLAIVRHVVELHGGSVSAASDGEGKGTTITVKLPLAPLRGAAAGDTQLASAARTEIASVEAAPRLEGLHVLVVDDDADSRELLSMTLKRCGARVSTAPAARRAFQVFAETQPDIILSDIEMPDEDGYWLLSQIRALPPELGGRVPAAALTAYARSEDRVKALERGFQAHLAKPIDAHELVAIVGTLAARPQRGGAD